MDNTLDKNILLEAGIDLNHSLELLGDMEMVNDTFNDFYEESLTRLPKIKEYKDNIDMPNYAVLVHAMKSDSKYLGMMTLADLSYQHEMASKESNYNFVCDNFESLMNEADRMMAVIKKYLGK